MAGELFKACVAAKKLAVPGVSSEKKCQEETKDWTIPTAVFSIYLQEQLVPRRQ